MEILNYTFSDKYIKYFFIKMYKYMKIFYKNSKCIQSLLFIYFIFIKMLFLRSLYNYDLKTLLINEISYSLD
jgi:hypothetical protein